MGWTEYCKVSVGLQVPKQTDIDDPTDSYYAPQIFSSVRYFTCDDFQPRF